LPNHYIGNPVESQLLFQFTDSCGLEKKLKVILI